MPRFSLLSLFTIVTAVALAFAGFRAFNREFDPFDDVKFTPAAWAKIGPMERARMSDDLVRNHLLRGVSRSHVEDLIGTGQLVWTQDDVEGETHRYDIGSWPSVGLHEAFITVRYDEHGNVSDANIDGL
jgi:hypothetical protein